MEYNSGNELLLFYFIFFETLLFDDETVDEINKFKTAALAEKRKMVSISSRDSKDIKSFQPFKLRNEVSNSPFSNFLEVSRRIPFQSTIFYCHHCYEAFYEYDRSREHQVYSKN